MKTVQYLVRINRDLDSDWGDVYPICLAASRPEKRLTVHFVEPSELSSSMCAGFAKMGYPFLGQAFLLLHIKSIFLDAGGVLVWPNWTRVSHVLRAHGVEVSVDRLAAAGPLARVALDRPETIAASTDQRRGPTYAGVSPSDRTAAAFDELLEYHRKHNLWETVPDFVVPALAQLRRAGYGIVVVSNANGTLQRAFARLGLTPFTDVILDSAVEGVEKPDPRFFELALARSGARVETTVHVGDMYHVDVTGARAAGLSAILVDERHLRPSADCPRIPSIASLPDLLAVR